jgi:hypothetical protein
MVARLRGAKLGLGEEGERAKAAGHRRRRLAGNGRPVIRPQHPPGRRQKIHAPAMQATTAIIQSRGYILLKSISRSSSYVY